MEDVYLNKAEEILNEINPITAETKIQLATAYIGLALAIRSMEREW